MDNNTEYFNTAFLAKVSPSAVASSINRQRQPWDAIAHQVQHNIGTVLAPTNGNSYAFNPHDRVGLFPDTTTGFERVLSCIDRDYAGSCPTLLTTDLEYPGVSRAIKHSWRSPVVVAQVSPGAMVSNAEADAYLHEMLARSYNIVKPRVVLLSHVARTTGQVLSAETLRYFRDANPCVLIVVDGSQAVGNVVVGLEFLQACDFYVASGHKWLGGMATSGFVWRSDPERWDLSDAASQGQLSHNSNIAAWISLAASISDMTGSHPNARLQQISRHHRRLGKAFRDRLSELDSDVAFVTPFRRGRPPSGLVTVSIPMSAGHALVSGLRADGYEFSTMEAAQVDWRADREDAFLLRWESGMSVVEHVGRYYSSEHANMPSRRLRFCFHRSHTEDDVLRLADAIAHHAKARDLVVGGGPRSGQTPAAPRASACV